MTPLRLLAPKRVSAVAPLAGIIAQANDAFSSRMVVCISSTPLRQLNVSRRCVCYYQPRSLGRSCVSEARLALDAGVPACRANAQSFDPFLRSSKLTVLADRQLTSTALAMRVPALANTHHSPVWWRHGAEDPVLKRRMPRERYAAFVKGQWELARSEVSCQASA